MTARLPSHAVARRRRHPNLTRSELDAVLANLVDSDGAARLLGLSDGRSIRAYASRFEHFPRPVLPVGGSVSGKSSYWWVPDLEAWRDAHPPRST